MKMEIAEHARAMIAPVREAVLDGRCTCACGNGCEKQLDKFGVHHHCAIIDPCFKVVNQHTLAEHVECCDWVAIPE
jgi:hypothetical protein